MPHAELKYCDDLDFNAQKLLANIEQIILLHDNQSGECKGRAYPATHYHHTHCLLSAMMLTKPHRDTDFTRALLQDLEKEMKTYLKQVCFLSLGIQYSDAGYLKNENTP